MAYLLWERRQTLSDVTGLTGEQLRVIDKLTTLLSTKDPLAFQAVQAMQYQHGYSVPDDEIYDPSDEAENRRLEYREQSERDELNGTERDAYDAIFGIHVPGLSPERD